LESAKNNITQRKNSHELFGYDIMVDEQLNPWLIEVNSSPAMDYSTPVTENLVKSMSEDLIKVVVDYYGADKDNRNNVDTGLFKQIYNDNLQDITKSLKPTSASLKEHRFINF
jgi:tubulin monoglycylase TTLL3/8